MNLRLLLPVLILALLLAVPALGGAPPTKRKPYADIEHWRCQVNDKHWLKFRVVEGEMRAPKQPWPKEM